MLAMKFEIPAMLGRGGAIVNMASIAGLRGLGALAYTASKHAVVGMSQAAALRWAAQGIRINVVCPGTILTPMLERAVALGAPSLMPEAQPIGRLGTAEEVADAVVWLCSPRSSFVVGHPLVVDGGLLAR
jgi:NAD(P)-dependent dehydrogenase (short-subunit alcohol dehydrogenase family)